MEKYKEEFVKFLLESGALKFGEFTLKSKRISPYFINTGMFNDGNSISRLGYFYAAKIHEEFKSNFDVLYGPAYKGISLALTTAISLSKYFKINKKYSFNRKEEKYHSDKGVLVGYDLKDNDRIIVLDDVFTTGETKEETIALLKNIANVKYICILIAVDRQETGKDGKSAIKEFEKKYSIPVKSIITINEIVVLLHNKKIKGRIYIDNNLKDKIDEYLERYGVR